MEVKYELDQWDIASEWEVHYEIDPSDDGEQWKLPRKDPWGKWRCNDVIDGGDHWLIVDGNGMTYTEPKQMYRVYKRPYPERTRSAGF